MKKFGVALAAIVAAGAFGVGEASADTYTFTAITNNGGNTAAAEAQLRVDVTDAGMGQVLFTFYHDGMVAMSITDIYFDDDGNLASIFSIDDSDPGVSFAVGATPGDLPGGNSVGFMATLGLTADSDPPTQPNGVNPGESVGILINLAGGKSFADVIAALGYGFESGGLVIGIHVQGFDGGFSEAFITGGGDEPMVPVPSGVALGLAGLAPVMTRRRRA